MRSIILFVIAILLPLGVSAQNYDEFLEAAKKHLQAGKTEKAISCYNIYKKMTKKQDIQIENAIKNIQGNMGALEYKTMTYSNGKYEGYFLNDKRHGQGTYYYSSGDRYVGEWKDSEMHGQGTYYYSDGEKYDGNFVDGKTNGQGTYYFSNGDKYVGEWKDGNKHGQGTFYWSEGDRYVGEWKDDNKHGQGTFYWSEGDRYVGEWKDDEKHGQGTYYSKASNTVTKGIWAYGSLIRKL